MGYSCSVAYWRRFMAYSTSFQIRYFPHLLLSMMWKNERCYNIMHERLLWTKMHSMWIPNNNCYYRMHWSLLPLHIHIRLRQCICGKFSEFSEMICYHLSIQKWYRVEWLRCAFPIIEQCSQTCILRANANAVRSVITGGNIKGGTKGSARKHSALTVIGRRCINRRIVEWSLHYSTENSEFNNTKFQKTVTIILASSDWWTLFTPYIYSAKLFHKMSSNDIEYVHLFTEIERKMDTICGHHTIRNAILGRAFKFNCTAIVRGRWRAVCATTNCKYIV